MDAKSKIRTSDGTQNARRSRRLHAFLGAWAKRHWPERVTRFARR
jgi:hypothetical protein